MIFLIADTFTTSLTRLSGSDQKSVKTTAFDLQMNPAHPSMNLHRLDRAKDKNFWSVRAGSDLRIIVHRTSGTFVLCYADHHDKAYAWAERRRLEAHPVTGAAQIVEFRERVEEIVVPHYVEAPPCADLTDDEMLTWGVPQDWLYPVRRANEDELLEIAERLPAEAAEAILEYAAGGTPSVASGEQPRSPAPVGSDPFSHPAAQQRFRVVEGIEELERALDYPWDRWLVFLHPQQRSIVKHDWDGPARVRGSAGTGKTVVALHRAVFLARRDESSRVLLTTFSPLLAKHLSRQLRRLVGNEPRVAERIDVVSVDDVVRRLSPSLAIASHEEVESHIESLYHDESMSAEFPFTLSFVRDEWNHVVDVHNLTTWEDYRDFQRIGRKTRLAEARRKALWGFLETLRARLAEEHQIPWGNAYHQLSVEFESRRPRPYSYVVADEAQDISPAQLRFLSALAGHGRNALFFAGDTGQRIFRQPYSWARMGVDVRGRSRILRVNYRTSHQIRITADRLLDPEITDPDGVEEVRSDTVSVFNGPQPEIVVCSSLDDETARVSAWIAERVTEGRDPESIGIVVRTDHQRERAKAIVEAIANRTDGTLPGIVTMHEAKGLEFSAVAVVACDDDVIPSQERIENVGDEGDLEEVYATERQLLYVACTRARDQLIVTGVEPASEFLDDMAP